MLSRLNVVRLKMIRFRPLSGSYISQWNVKSIIKFYIIQSFRPLSGSYISQYIKENAEVHQFAAVSVPYRGATFLNSMYLSYYLKVSVPYRGATFLNKTFDSTRIQVKAFPSPIGELHFSIINCFSVRKFFYSFRPLSGSYISQYHPRNPMSCLGRIGGLRGKSNFIEMQPFWKVKNSHKSSI